TTQEPTALHARPERPPRRPARARGSPALPDGRGTSRAPDRAAGAPGRVPADASRSRGRFRRLLCRLLVRLGQELLSELALALRVELLQLVLDCAAVVGLVPVVERLEAEQNRLADELAQHL